MKCSMWIALIPGLVMVTFSSSTFPALGQALSPPAVAESPNPSLRPDFPRLVLTPDPVFTTWVYPGATEIGGGGDSDASLPKGVHTVHIHDGRPGGRRLDVELTTDALFADVWKFYGQKVGIKTVNDFDIDYDKAPAFSRRYTNGLASIYLHSGIEEGNFLTETDQYTLSIFITRAKTEKATYIQLKLIEKYTPLPHATSSPP